MAVKKATSVAKRDVPPKKAAQTKAVATKAAAKTTTKASATKAAEGRKARAAESSGSPTAQPQRLRVRENEKPWTAKELATVRAALEADIVRLQREISAAELALAGLMLDAGGGAGDDQADAGTATFEREQEISLANNAREVFEQSARALARLVDGSYGICESCAGPIGKNRLLAFPRATLCMTCKSKQERR
jgi:RNA polymerase-binding transcription factor DksA